MGESSKEKAAPKTFEEWWNNIRPLTLAVLPLLTASRIEPEPFDYEHLEAKIRSKVNMDSATPQEWISVLPPLPKPQNEWLEWLANGPNSTPQLLAKHLLAAQRKIDAALVILNCASRVDRPGGLMQSEAIFQAIAALIGEG